jgi:3-hydroxyisobutyrate dehydrogenase
MESEKPAVAVLGMGVMGRAMARAILRAGLPTTVWNRRPEAAEELTADGARVARDVADAVRNADVVITMVTDADAVLSIADSGMLAALPGGAIWAQMSTIGVDGIERVQRLVEERRPDVTLLDAPVAGSRGPAELGKLTVFASGPESVRARVAPVFDAVGQRTVWSGPVGAGSKVKLVNNMVLAFATQGLAESLGVAADLGLDLPTVLAALDGSPLVSPWAAQKLGRIGKGEYGPEYALSLGLKDVDLALAHAPIDRLSAANAILGQWRRAADRGLGDEDVTVVVRELMNSMHT